MEYAFPRLPAHPPCLSHPPPSPIYPPDFSPRHMHLCASVCFPPPLSISHTHKLLLTIQLYDRSFLPTLPSVGPFALLPMLSRELPGSLFALPSPNISCPCVSHLHPPTQQFLILLQTYALSPSFSQAVASQLSCPWPTMPMLMVSQPAGPNPPHACTVLNSGKHT